MICNSTVTASTHAAASEIAAANSSRCPASRNTRTAAVASDPTTATSVRRRRPNSRMRVVS